MRNWWRAIFPTFYVITSIEFSTVIPGLLTMVEFYCLWCWKGQISGCIFSVSSLTAQIETAFSLNKYTAKVKHKWFVWFWTQVRWVCALFFSFFLCCCICVYIYIYVPCSIQLYKQSSHFIFTSFTTPTLRKGDSSVVIVLQVSWYLCLILLVLWPFCFRWQTCR